MAGVCLRFYLDPTCPDGLRAEPEPGRCERFWQLSTLASQAKTIAQNARNMLRPALELDESVTDARQRMSVHLEVCPECRAWVEACELALIGIKVAELATVP